MWRSVLLLCGILAAANGLNFKIRRPISKCIKHKGPLPLSAEVEGCSNSPPPCVLTQGKKTLIFIAFRAPRYTTTMTTLITIYQTILRVVYELPQHSGVGYKTCASLLDGTCPVRQGEILLYPLEMLVNDSTFKPGEAAAAEIRIVDDEEEVTMCIRLEFVIKPAQGQPLDSKNRDRKFFSIRALYNGK